MAAIVGKDSNAAANGHIVADGYVLGVGDILRVDESMASNFHPHSLEEPDAKGCQGHKGEEDVARQIEQSVVQKPGRGPQGIVPPFERMDSCGQNPVVNRHNLEGQNLLIQ